MNIIEHLSRTVTPVVLGNNANDTNRASLLEKVYAIIVARLADNGIYNGFADTTVSKEDTGFFDRLLPETTHRSNMVRELSKQYNVPEQETQNLVNRAAPLAYNEVRNLAGSSSVSSFLGSNLSSVGTALPAWSYAMLPAGVLGSLNINQPNANLNKTQTTTRPTTRVEEQLVATPKREEGGLMKMLLPLIGLLILAALAWALLRSCNHKPEPVVAPASAPASTIASTPLTTTASVNNATVTASTVVIQPASSTGASTTANSATAMASMPSMTGNDTNSANAATVVSSTEPSVMFENGHLNFYFATGKADVAGNAKEKASEILAAAQQGKKIGISGYTDSTGDKALNAKLSRDRANAVKKFLTDNGVPASQLELIKPRNTTGATGKDQEGRRVEVYVVDGPDVVKQTIMPASVTK